MNGSRVQARRAIEALRSGVPNRDAVDALGSSQTQIESLFRQRLAAVREGLPGPGLVFDGDFGGGKSHLLEYLQHIALTERFVTSKVVVSKETPLHDPAKVFRAAISAAVVPERRGAAVTEIAGSLDPDGAAFDELYRWTSSDQAELNERFPATLYLYRNLRGADPELVERILRFWSGDPLSVAELRRALRRAGEGASWIVSKASQRELALQRIRFVARLAAAAGYGGWVLLFDEVELVGRYSLLQRARSYAEIARWVLGEESGPLPGLVAVLAITDDFLPFVIDEKHDDETVPGRLRLRGEEPLAEQAELGIEAIRRAAHLERPGEHVLGEAYRKLKAIHETAYGWEAPDVAGPAALGTRSMREYVRAWINEWDLRRLDPSYRPELEFEPVSPDYTEDADLETSPDGEQRNGG